MNFADYLKDEIESGFHLSDAEFEERRSSLIDNGFVVCGLEIPPGGQDRYDVIWVRDGTESTSWEPKTVAEVAGLTVDPDTEIVNISRTIKEGESQ